jgi:hypothetical protein
MSAAEHAAGMTEHWTMPRRRTCCGAQNEPRHGALSSMRCERVAALAMFAAITNAWKNVKTMRATITPNGRRGSQVLRRLIIDHTPAGEANYGTTMEQTSGLRQMPS